MDEINKTVPEQTVDSVEAMLNDDTQEEVREDKAEDTAEQSAEKPKNKGGRPAWIPTAETLEQVEKLASMGMTQQQIADCLDIGISTLMAKKNEFEEFSDAIKRGQAKGVAHVTSKLMAKISAMDTTSILFYLKCKGGFSESSSLDITSNGTNKVEVVVTGGPPVG